MDNEEKVQSTSTEKPSTASVVDKTAAEKRAEARAARKEKRRQKKEVRRLRREYEERKKRVPQHKKPIICPPDCSDASNKMVVWGYIIRAVVIFVAVLALSFFVSEAFGFDMAYLSDIGNLSSADEYKGVLAGAGIGFLALWSLVFVAIFTLSSLIKRGYLIGVPLSILIALAFTLPNPIQTVYEAVLTTYNGALGHMQFMGFYGYGKYVVEVTQTTGSPEKLVRVALVFFVLLTAAIFTPSLIRRVKIVAPAIFATLVLVGVFMFNLSRSNWAITLIIASFSAIIVMSVYDKLYIAKPKADEYDSTDNIFGEVEPPPMPERVVSKKAKRQERRLLREQRRAEKKARRKAKKTQTVEEELTEYFADPAAGREKKKKIRLTPEQKKAARAEREEARRKKKEERKADRAAMGKVHAFRRGRLTRSAAMGGFAGAGAMVLALVMLFFPTLTVSGSFETIDAIDNKMDYYRDYITALMMGDDPALDTLAYEGDDRNFAPRTTDASPRYYSGRPLITVESNFGYNTYLRGWVGTTYSDGAWNTAKPYSDTYERYRYLFGTTTDPSETIYHKFFNVLASEDMPEYEYDYTSKTKRLEKYGFGITQVNMLRDNSFSSRTLYMPSQNILRDVSGGSQYLRSFGGASEGNISYANFFDGIYTSYRAGLLTDEGYATVAMLQTMKSEAFYYNIADLIIELNTERYAINKGVNQKMDGSGKVVNELRYADGSKLNYTVFEDTASGATIIKIPLENGTAVYTCKDGEITRSMEDYEEVLDDEGNPIKLYAPPLPLSVRYFELMTSAEKQEYLTLLRYIDLYTPYVYNTYMEKSDSTIIKELSEKIISEATVEKYVEDENGITHLTAVPIDLSKAMGKSTYRETSDGEYVLLTAVTDGDVYKQRHELVMEVIDYLTDEENFTYTLNPTKETDPSLDGVENFLTVTKEGYCVQFASAAALLIREAGIPVRYVEGYLATDFVSNNKDGAAGRYITTVKDYNEHAWIEVWYDGLGWIQYETTPVFYDDYYDVGSSSSSDINRPWEDDEEEEEEKEEDPFDGLTDYEIEQLIKEQEEAARRELIKKIIIYTSVSIVVISLLVLFFALVWRRARRLQRGRDELLDALTATKNKDAEVPDRESIRRISEMISRLLSECKLSPRIGEFREEYALRIARECSGALSRPAASEKLSGFEAETSVVRERDVLAMFDALAAEEFGNGAPVASMPTMAKFYRRVYASTYRRRVNIFRKIYLYFVKGEM